MTRRRSLVARAGRVMATVLVTALLAAPTAAAQISADEPESTPRPTHCTDTGREAGTPLPTQLPESECIALLVLHHDTGGSDWVTAEGWATDTDPCTWYGVLCSNGHVLALYLPSNGLTGALPAELAALQDARVFVFVRNEISSIPDSLSDLDELRALILDSNLLTRIPTSIGGLAGLQTLSLIHI